MLEVARSFECVLICVLMQSHLAIYAAGVTLGRLPMGDFHPLGQRRVPARHLLEPRGAVLFAVHVRVRYG